MSFPAISKQTLRNEALARRDILAEHERFEASLSLVRYADELGSVAAANVAGYWPIGSEIDVRPLMAALRVRGARLCLPAVLDRHNMEFRTWEEGAAMVEAGFGTQAPGPDAPLIMPDLMIVPLAAFDGRGHRIGYGRGFYDRAVALLQDAGRPPRLIGAAFDCQRVEKVPEEPHDVMLPQILTESGLHSFANHL